MKIQILVKFNECKYINMCCKIKEEEEEKMRK